MSKKVIVVNAGPRLNWNTDTLLTNAANALKDNGIEIKRYDLFRLDKYTGCISCFGCKKEKFKGQCICKDGLTQVLDDIRESDGLIIGSPNYLSEVTSSFRALYERLIFQNLTYNVDNYCCNLHMIPVLFIFTSNGPKENNEKIIEPYKNTFNRFIGPTEVYICGNTKQIKDYSKTDWPWSIFNVEDKEKKHKEVFPKECKEVYELSKKIFCK